MHSIPVYVIVRKPDELFRYDTALSVETPHHFTHEEKIGLYRKLCRGLKPGSVYVEYDDMAPDQAYEDFYFAKNRRIRAELGITEGFTILIRHVPWRIRSEC